ncbi:MAG TPA: hypothetical protein VEC57_21020 [Candidatus Limnocylindrales bacterium]|nr:hypothetical protein [Candidatus Limnocylindrales bacterium]
MRSKSLKLEMIESDVIASLRKPTVRDMPTSFSDLVSGAFRAKRITYRRHGLNGELLKPASC